MTFLSFILLMGSTCTGTNTCDIGPNVSCSLDIPDGYRCEVIYMEFGISCAIIDPSTNTKVQTDQELCWPDPGGAGSLGGGDNGISAANITTLDDLLCYIHGICHY